MEYAKLGSSAEVMAAMIEYFGQDARRIHHFLKVYAFAKTIGELEGLDEKTQEVLEIAALTHDIGIKISEEKYNSSSGHYQQIEGPGEVIKLLQHLQIEDAVIDRCAWLIAHHHTYDQIIGMDYQILVEADFLVNAYEDEMSKAAVESVMKKIFRTKTGTEFLMRITGIEPA